METEYNFPGTFKITLDEVDVSSIRARGFCTDRNGFAGIDNKTWVHAERSLKVGRAIIDGGGDLIVHIPSDAAFHCDISRENISADREASISHYLGETGIIQVEWSHTE